MTTNVISLVSIGAHPTSGRPRRAEQDARAVELGLQMAGDKFEVESAGLEPGKLNSIVVEAMKEVGIDISQNKTKSVFDFYKQGKQYDYVITVCDESQSGACPMFPGKGERLHWGFDDPSGFQGTQEDKLRQTREVRNQIEAKIKDWLKFA